MTSEDYNEKYYCSECEHEHNPGTDIHEDHLENRVEAESDNDEELLERFYPANHVDGETVPAKTIEAESRAECDSKYEEYKQKVLNE